MKGLFQDGFGFSGSQSSHAAGLRVVQSGRTIGLTERNLDAYDIRTLSSGPEENTINIRGYGLLIPPDSVPVIPILAAERRT